MGWREIYRQVVMVKREAQPQNTFVEAPPRSPAWEIP